MKKFLLLFATMAMLFSAAPVFAQCESPKIEMIAAASEAGLKTIDLTEIPMENFMTFFNTVTNGPPPFEYDNVIIVLSDELARVSLAKDGCIVVSTRPFPRILINDFIREAKLENNG